MARLLRSSFEGCDDDEPGAPGAPNVRPCEQITASDSGKAEAAVVVDRRVGGCSPTAVGASVTSCFAIVPLVRRRRAPSGQAPIRRLPPG